MEEILLTTQELADRLRVPISWVYGQTRKKGKDVIPCLRVGKYVRFLETEVLQWLKTRNSKTLEKSL